MLDLQKRKNRENISEEHEENDINELPIMINQIDLHTNHSDMVILQKKSDCTLIRK